MVVEGLIKIIMRQADPTTYMEKRRKENASPYVLPVNSQKKYRIKKLSSYSLDTYMLKSASYFCPPGWTLLYVIHKLHL